MALKTIKGIDDQSWVEFKSIAAKNGMKMGKLFETMLEEYKKKSDESWDKILHSGKILTDVEAKEMVKITRKTREEYGFRR